MVTGEHAVLYGYPCIVTTVDRYIKVTGGKTLRLKDEFDTGHITDKRFLIAAVDTFKKKFGITNAVYIKTESTLGNYGLGSSAATVVATIGLLITIFDISVTKQMFFDLSLQAVLQVQKKASGFDVAACIYGGTIYFDGKTKKTRRLLCHNFPLVVGFVQMKASTSSLIEQVYQRYEKERYKTELIFQNIKKKVQGIERTLTEKNWKQMGKYITQNHRLLQQLGVSTDMLDKGVYSAIKAGAHGAKLSGAGGGDCMIALCTYNKRYLVESALQKEGLEILRLKTGVKGFTLL